MISVLTAGICLLLVAVGVVRIRNGSAQSTPTYWAYTQVCLLVGLAKLARTPVITDDVINPALKTVTGLANVMTFVGMSLAACATVPAVVLMLALTGRPVAYRPWFIAQAAIAGAMFIAYVISPIADIPSSYITTDIPFTWSVWMYWGVFLGSVGLAGALNAALAVQAVRVVRSGPFALTLSGWATTAALACIYTVNKIVDLAMTELDIEDNWYTEHVKTISLILALLIALAAMATVLIYPAVRLPYRVRRFKVLRKSAATWLAARQEYPEFALPMADPPATQWQCWTAAKDPLSAYSLQVELADARNAADRKAGRPADDQPTGSIA
ncbi:MULTISPECIES: hypothetical protein [Williamsia]|uniref:Integral membrane protein n=1 Tax=Williamsia marianensis TaxID=85044 RepID=A0A495IUB3_WILMA|nr:MULTISPECIES: hypothetical protein [Williamsia]ETD31694.1 hypothetical protein W823_17750 [Williamsia sp. D3]PZU02022.1 MAG: hypothetical protein DI630_10100 [Gordonia sp. (in: high G+C Gram-positive bacteria)]RKR79891.1 hypothetical protein DFJ75_5034 [Williamsia muralis]